MGRKAWKPTDKERTQARAMAQRQCPNDLIAEVLGIGLTTLKKHLQKELSLGRAEGKASLFQALYNMAVNKQIPAVAIFLAKVQLGMREGFDVRAQMAELPNITFGTYGQPGFTELRNNEQSSSEKTNSAD